MKDSAIDNFLTIGGIYKPKEAANTPPGCKYRILVMDEKEVLYDYYYPLIGWAIADHLKATCNFYRMAVNEFSTRFGSNGLMNLNDREHEVIRPDLPVTVDVSASASEPAEIALGTPRVVIEYYQPRRRRAKVFSLTSSDPRGFSHREALRKLAATPEINASGREIHHIRLRRTGIRRQLPLYVVDEITWSDSAQ